MRVDLDAFDKLRYDNGWQRPGRYARLVSSGSARFLRRPASSPALLALVAGIALHGALVVGVPLIGFVDGGFHLDTAVILGNSLDGLHEPASGYLEWVPLPFPNLLPEVLLAAFTLVLSPEWAERTLVLLYVASLPLAFLYALRGVTRERDWLALFSLPLTFTFVLHYGFYNFSFSLVLFLLVVGYTLRLPDRPSNRRALVLVGLLAATFMAHIVGFVQAVLYVVVSILWRRIAAGRRDGSSWMAWVAAAGLAAAIVFAIGTGTAMPYAFGNKPEQLVATLTLGWGLVTFSRLELVSTTLLALVLLALVVSVVSKRNPFRQRSKHDELLWFSAVALLAAVVAPSSVDGGLATILTQRLALFPAFSLVLWLGAQPLTTRLLRLAGLSFLIAAVGLALVRLPSYREVSRLVDDFMTTAPCVAERSTMLQATLHLPNFDRPAWRLDPGRHETGRIAAETHGLDLGDVDFSSQYFVLRFRDARSPLLVVPTPRGAIDPSALEEVPPSFDLRGYERSTGGRVDYVMVVGRSKADAAVLASRSWRDLRTQFKDLYVMVDRSPGGWVEVWERDVRDLRSRGRAARVGTNCGRTASTGQPQLKHVPKR